MAKYRCLSDEILYNDNFLSLPPSARDLYNYINQKTDDHGFCAEVNSIMRTLRCKPKDLELLIERHYLIKFEEWLYLEKHFYINNRNLRKDRIKPTNYGEYLAKVTLKDNGAYTLGVNLQPIDDKVQPIDDKWLPNDDKAQPIDDKMARNTIQYNTIQSNLIQNKEIQTKDELMSLMRG